MWARRRVDRRLAALLRTTVLFAAQRRRSTRVVDTLLWLAAFGVCASTVFALAGRNHWIAELFTHFRVQYVAVQIALLIAVAARSLRIASLIVPFLAYNVVVVADYWPSNAATAPEPGDVTLLMANLNFTNTDTNAFLTLVRDEQPDVIVVLEVTAAWSAALATLGADYPARRIVPREDAFGIGILSRLPFAALETVDLRGTPAIDARLLPRVGAPLRLIAAHLHPPVSRRLAHERNAQLTILADLVGDSPEPSIVTGDLNITPYSPIFADWLAVTGLADPQRGRGFAMTWPVQFPLLGVSIDHCLVSEHVIASGLRRSRAFGSDHYAIVTSLSLRGN